MFLTIAAAVIVALLVIGAILKTSMWFADRKKNASVGSWMDQGSGNSDGYGRSDYGDSNGCGGGGD